MDSIAVVDDRADMRESVAGLIEAGLERSGLNWKVICDEPLQDIGSYPSWIRENDVRVLVLDEKLGEVVGSSGSAVEYAGHDVAALLRERIPELPQVIITSVADSDDLDGAAELDAVVQRKEFTKHWRVHVDRMIRMGARYVERNEAELDELTELSKKVVGGGATEDEIAALNRIRAKVERVESGAGIVTIRQWLDDAGEVRDKLERALAALKSKVGE